MDDDKADHHFVECFAFGLRYIVSVAHDGLDAMVQVRKNLPDLIILDMMMPELNGYDVCSNIKFDENLNISLLLF